MCSPHAPLLLSRFTHHPRLTTLLFLLQIHRHLLVLCSGFIYRGSRRYSRNILYGSKLRACIIPNRSRGSRCPADGGGVSRHYFFYLALRLFGRPSKWIDVEVLWKRRANYTPHGRLDRFRCVKQGSSSESSFCPREFSESEYERKDWVRRQGRNSH